MRMKLSIELNDGTAHTINDIPYSSLIAFEREYGVSIKKFQEEHRAEWLGFLAHNAFRKEGFIPQDMALEAFFDNLKKITATNEDAEGDDVSGEGESSSTAA
jgi:hypothetical protein